MVELRVKFYLIFAIIVSSPCLDPPSSSVDFELYRGPIYFFRKFG